LKGTRNCYDSATGGLIALIPPNNSINKYIEENLKGTRKALIFLKKYSNELQNPIFQFR